MKWTAVWEAEASHFKLLATILAAFAAFAALLTHHMAERQDDAVDQLSPSANANADADTDATCVCSCPTKSPSPRARVLLSLFSTQRSSVPELLQVTHLRDHRFEALAPCVPRGFGLRR